MCTKILSLMIEFTKRAQRYPYTFISKTITALFQYANQILDTLYVSLWLNFNTIFQSVISNQQKKVLCAGIPDPFHQFSHICFVRVKAILYTLCGTR